MEQIGYLSACIAGDSRYTTIIRVTADRRTKEVIVRVTESGAVGGSDGPGGSYNVGEKYSEQLDNPSGALLIDAVRRGLSTDDIFKSYGKPTKNFSWGCRGVRGLSAAKAQEALEQVGF